MLQETLELKPSERAVFKVAGQLMSGFIAKHGFPNEADHQAVVDWCINTAYAMAQQVDKQIISDDELG